MKIFKVILFLLVFFICGCYSNFKKETQVLMGSFCEVTSDDPKAYSIVFDEIKRMENKLSKFKKDSELSELNRLGKIKASTELYYILKQSLYFYKVSNGAFDITIAPLMDLWGFTDKNFKVPNNQQIKQILKTVGMNKIVFNDKNSVVKFTVSGMKIDLGAIAVGYAVDCAVKKLKENNIKNCLINLGGEIYCLGLKDNNPWKVAIQDPRNKDKIITVLDLTNQAVTTSGDYESFFEKDKKHYTHIMDPKKGVPINSDFSSVTIVANDCLTADALSTTVFVLGKTKTKELLTKFNNVKLIEQNADKR